MFNKFTSSMLLVGLAAADAGGSTIEVDSDSNNLPIIIVAVVLGTTLCCFLCCFGISKATSKPNGVVDDRFEPEFVAKVDNWLKEEVAKGNPNIVVFTDFKWPEENPVDLKVPDSLEVFI